MADTNQQSANPLWIGSKYSAASLKKEPTSAHCPFGGVQPSSANTLDQIAASVALSNTRASAASRRVGNCPISIDQPPARDGMTLRTGASSTDPPTSCLSSP